MRRSLLLLVALAVLLAVPASASAGDRTWRYWYAQDGTPNHHVVDLSSGYCEFRAAITPNWSEWATVDAWRCVGPTGWTGTWSSVTYRNGEEKLPISCYLQVEQHNNPATWKNWKCRYSASPAGTWYNVGSWRADIGNAWHWQAGANYTDNVFADHSTHIGPAGEVLEFSLWVYP